MPGFRKSGHIWLYIPLSVDGVDVANNIVLVDTLCKQGIIITLNT